MHILDYIIDFLFLLNPWGKKGNVTTIELLENDIQHLLEDKKKLKRTIKLLEIKKIDYSSLKETTDKLTETYKELSKVLTKKDLEINALKDLIDKYEQSFLEVETDKKKMVDILDSYKNNLQQLLHWKEQAIKTMDAQAVDISRLKKMNLKLLAELKTFKKD